MVINLNCINKKTDDLTLKEAYQKMDLDQPDEIPWIIRLFENPRSPLALPGCISLHDHDCLHILLGRGVTPQDEAFVLGFAMGSDVRTKLWHIQLFKFLSRFVYPAKYRFTCQDMTVFNLGFKYGENLFRVNLNQLSFKCFYNYKLKHLRSLLGIDINTVNSLIL